MRRPGSVNDSDLNSNLRLVFAPVSGAINFVGPLDQFSVLTISLKTRSFGCNGKVVTSSNVNFDYPSSYNKTPKHVITFFIIFILKTLQPRRLWFRISRSPISSSLARSWPCMAWSWQWPFIGLYLKVLLGSEPPSWTLLSFSILSLAVSDLGIWPKF